MVDVQVGYGRDLWCDHGLIDIHVGPWLLTQELLTGIAQPSAHRLQLLGVELVQPLLTAGPARRHHVILPHARALPTELRLLHLSVGVRRHLRNAGQPR